MSMSSEAIRSGARRAYALIGGVEPSQPVYLSWIAALELAVP